MRSPSFLLILAGVMLLLDFYVFQILKFVTQSAGPKTRSVVYVAYWVISISFLILLFVLPYLQLNQLFKGARNTFFAIIVGLFLAKLIGSIFFAIDDIRRGMQWLVGKLFFTKTEGEQIATGVGISRSLFLSWLGLGISGGIYGSLLYGFSNKYNYKVKKVPVTFSNLPDSFKGLKVVQISDIHSGSFSDRDAVKRGVDKLMKLDPDLILFTGDLVNNEAREMDDYLKVFSEVKAPMGVYSILGNHDYGDYHNWASAEEKQKNLENVKLVHADMGWRLLMDEHVPLERNGESIALIGIQNWSNLGSFPKYGNLAKAYAGAEKYPFRILMSHDPTHWDAQVRPQFGDIDLTLAGHTHGMQFGVEIPGFRWSPVEYVYRQWAGLYREGNQVIYVNRGWGFIGYPGRVGILPEITLLELT